MVRWLKIDKNEVVIDFKSGKSTTFYKIIKVDTDINYSMYQLINEKGTQYFIKDEVIECISFGCNVEIEEH